MRSTVCVALLAMTTIAGVGSLAAPSGTICIQGNLADAVGQPLAGTRAFRVQFHDAPADGTELGAPTTGFVTVAASGRFSISLTPPAQVVEAPG